MSPEAIGNGSGTFRVPQVTWSSPVTNRFLLDAGFGGNYNGYGHRERKGNTTRPLIRVSEQCAAGCPANGDIPGLVYRSQDWLDAWQGLMELARLGLLCHWVRTASRSDTRETSSPTIRSGTPTTSNSPIG